MGDVINADFKDGVVLGDEFTPLETQLAQMTNEERLALALQQHARLAKLRAKAAQVDSRETYKERVAIQVSRCQIIMHSLEYDQQNMVHMYMEGYATE